MTAVAGEVVTTPFDLLTDDEVELGRAELCKHLGAEASEVTWMRRLGRRDDGEFMLSVRSTTPGVRGYENDVWSPSGPQIKSAYHPLAEGVALLRAGAEAEADRLAKIRSDFRAERAAEEAAEKERRSRESERNRLAQAEWAERKKRLRYDLWENTPVWAQSLLRQALIWAESHPVQAQKLYELGASAIGRAGPRGEPAGDMPLPETKWW